MLLPVPIGFILIDEYGTMFAAMTGRIALAVAIDVEPAHPARACDLCLPDAGVDGPTLPSDVARQADIDRKQTCHCVFPIWLRGSAVIIASDGVFGSLVVVRRCEQALPPAALRPI
jgi:hypothetical protein